MAEAGTLRRTTIQLNKQSSTLAPTDGQTDWKLILKMPVAECLNVDDGRHIMGRNARVAY